MTAVPPLFLLCAYLFLSLPPALPAFCFVPDNELSAFRTGGLADLVCKKGIDTVIFHILQVIDDMGVVADTVNDVFFAELFQAAAWELTACKAAGYLVFSGTVAETGKADCTVLRQFAGQTAFTGFRISRAGAAE